MVRVRTEYCRRGGIEDREEYVQDPEEESDETPSLDGSGTFSNGVLWERGGGT
jgi:hypothetical protein